MSVGITTLTKAFFKFFVKLSFFFDFVLERDDDDDDDLEDELDEDLDEDEEDEEDDDEELDDDDDDDDDDDADDSELFEWDIISLRFLVYFFLICRILDESNGWALNGKPDGGGGSMTSINSGGI